MEVVKAFFLPDLPKEGGFTSDSGLNGFYHLVLHHFETQRACKHAPFLNTLSQVKQQYDEELVFSRER